MVDKLEKLSDEVILARAKISALFWHVIGKDEDGRKKYANLEDDYNALLGLGFSCVKDALNSVDSCIRHNAEYFARYRTEVKTILQHLPSHAPFANEYERRKYLRYLATNNFGNRDIQGNPTFDSHVDHCNSCGVDFEIELTKHLIKKNRRKKLS